MTEQFLADSTPPPSYSHRMLKSSDARRRALGTLFLGATLVMLVWGQTALQSHLQGMQFLFYWTACMLLTFLTLMTALLDFWIVRRRGRAQRIALLKETLLEIKSSADEDPQSPEDPEEAAPNSEQTTGNEQPSATPPRPTTNG